MENRGQTLIEIIIATGVISLAMVAIMGVIIQSLVVGAESKQRTQATFLAQDAIEKISYIRNVNAKAIKGGQSIAWDLDFYEDVAGKQNGYYKYPKFMGEDTPLQLIWLSSTQINDSGGELIDYTYDGIAFTRYIQIIKRGGSANEREVNVRVTWPSSEGTGEVYLSAVITKLP
ncbi:hypothetical protein HGB13_02185 [bacterium]|nr:hypothetical protein [bacterium]